MTVPKYRFIQGRARKVFFIQDTRVNFYVRSTLQETSGANSMKNAARAPQAGSKAY